MTDTTTAAAVAPFRAKSIGIWAFRILMALLFLMAAAMKLSGQPMMVAEFNTVGLGQWFRYFTAALEVAGSLAVLIPRFSPGGALLLLVVDAGAFIAQVTVLHVDWIHTVVIGLALALLAYLQRGTFAAFRR
jgi:putative oxidoreductase